MLAKKFRLPIEVFPTKAKILHKGQYLAVKTSSNNLPHNRLGVIVTKKTAPRATERNRLRRKIFDLFRSCLLHQPADSQGKGSSKEGEDLLVIIKPTKLDRDIEKKLLAELNEVKQILVK